MHMVFPWPILLGGKDLNSQILVPPPDRAGVTDASNAAGMQRKGKRKEKKESNAELTSLLLSCYCFSVEQKRAYSASMNVIFFFF